MSSAAGVRRHVRRLTCGGEQARRETQAYYRKPQRLYNRAPMTTLARPFAALRPTAESAADVIAPPYDVVSTDEARALAANRPASFLHISRPEIDLPRGQLAVLRRGLRARRRESRAPTRRRRARARREPSFYVYRMVMNGRAQTGVAFAASVAAYEANRIRRHELTRPDKENDRVRNIATLNAQTGPVLLAYRANAALAELIGAAAAAKALFSVPGPNDVVHTVWRVGARAKVEASGRGTRRARHFLHRGRPSSLGGGGARRAAAARGRRAAREPRALSRGRVSARRDADPRLQPRGRRLERAFAGRAAREVGASFGVEPSAGRAAGGAGDVRDVRRRSLVPAADSARARAARRSRREPRREPAARAPARARSWASATRAPTSGSTSSAACAASWTSSSACANGAPRSRSRCIPTRMEQLMAVADAGKLMPPKSTWFEPKLADGLLSHVLD